MISRTKAHGSNDIEYHVMQVEDVDPAQHMAHVRDKRGGRMVIYYNHGFGAAAMVPKAGQFWVVSRYNYEWRLENRVDQQDDIMQMRHLDAGDTRLLADETLRVSARSIEVNDQPIGVMFWEKITPASAVTVITLAYEPVSISTVLAYNNGTLLDPSIMTLTGKALQLGTSAAGPIIIYYQYMP